MTFFLIFLRGETLFTISLQGWFGFFHEFSCWKKIRFSCRWSSSTNLYFGVLESFLSCAELCGPNYYYYCETRSVVALAIIPVNEAFHKKVFQQFRVPKKFQNTVRSAFIRYVHPGVSSSSPQDRHIPA